VTNYTTTERDVNLRDVYDVFIVHHTPMHYVGLLT